jgi:hypothetical protein
MQGAQLKKHLMKKEAPQNARGSMKKPPMKKEAPLKCKGLDLKDFR